MPSRELSSSLSFPNFILFAVQIQANSGLSQRDIDRMLKEAEQQKERDQKIKELAELKNEAETLIRSAEVRYTRLLVCDARL